MSNPFEPSAPPLTLGKIIVGVALGVMLAAGLLGGGWYGWQWYQARAARQQDTSTITQLSNAVEVTSQKLAEANALKEQLGETTTPEPAEPDMVFTTRDTQALKSGAVVVVIFMVCAAFYFLPSIIAAFRNHPNTLPVFVLNFFLGWTLLGWVVALCWSCTHIQQAPSNPYQRSASDLQL